MSDSQIYLVIQNHFLSDPTPPIVMENHFLPNPLQPLCHEKSHFCLYPRRVPPLAHDIICEQPLSSYDVFLKDLEENDR